MYCVELYSNNEEFRTFIIDYINIFYTAKKTVNINNRISDIIEEFKNKQKSLLVNLKDIISPSIFIGQKDIMESLDLIYCDIENLSGIIQDNINYLTEKLIHKNSSFLENEERLIENLIDIQSLNESNLVGENPNDFES